MMIRGEGKGVRKNWFFRRKLKKRKKQRKEGVARNERDFLGLEEKQSKGDGWNGRTSNDDDISIR